MEPKGSSIKLSTFLKYGLNEIKNVPSSMFDLVLNTACLGEHNFIRFKKRIQHGYTVCSCEYSKSFKEQIFFIELWWRLFNYVLVSEKKF